MNFPFEQKSVGDRIIRRFDSNVDKGELTWHRDGMSRIVEVITSDGWKLQLDNGLPKDLISGEKYFIKKGIWHRILIGRGDLLISIQEVEGENG